jgi:hypothetical protein
MCTVLLPPGVNTVAFNKYIKYQILIIAKLKTGKRAQKTERTRSLLRR